MQKQKKKKKKNTSRIHNRAKQAHVNTVVPATHLDNAQHMGMDVWDASILITIEQHAEV